MFLGRSQRGVILRNGSLSFLASCIQWGHFSKCFDFVFCVLCFSCFGFFYFFLFLYYFPISTMHAHPTRLEIPKQLLFSKPPDLGRFSVFELGLAPGISNILLVFFLYYVSTSTVHAHLTQGFTKVETDFHKNFEDESCQGLIEITAINQGDVLL